MANDHNATKFLEISAPFPSNSRGKNVKGVLFVLSDEALRGLRSRDVSLITWWWIRLLSYHSCDKEAKKISKTDWVVLHKAWTANWLVGNTPSNLERHFIQAYICGNEWSNFGLQSGKTYCAAFCASLALLAGSGNNAGCNEVESWWKHRMTDWW